MIIIKIILLLFTISEIIVHNTPLYYKSKNEKIVRCNYEFVQISLTKNVIVVFNIVENIICLFDYQRNINGISVCICNITIKINNE
jgi:hypothetical protein